MSAAKPPSARQGEPLTPYLEVAAVAARAGGRVVHDAVADRPALKIERKRANDFVSAVDKRSERAVIELIAGAFPTHAIKAEESGDFGNSDHLWLIDPLDGTTNFLHGFPHYCVSVALQIGADIAVAAIYAPVTAQLFTATRGGGAFLNGEPLRVTDRPSLAEALIGTGTPFSDWTFLNDYMASLRVIMQRCGGIRRPGAAALDLAYVAAGWLDGFWEKNLHPWDVGAGSLLVQEAGGAVSDFSGGPNFISGGQMVAGTLGVHRELVQVLRAYPALTGLAPTA